jgi:hypothetical protein
MKKIIMAAILLSQMAARAQADIRMVLDSSITLMQQHALYRNSPDWPTLRTEVYALAQGAGRLEDLGPSISHLFAAVQDHHGWLAVNDTTFKWPRPEMPWLNEAVVAGFAKGNRIVTKNLTGGIGYLRVPGMFTDTGSGTDTGSDVGSGSGTAMLDALAQRLADSLLVLHNAGATKYIIDLRLNAGGNMYPMIAGLSALLGNGSFVGSADAKGCVQDMTKLRNGVLKGVDGGQASVHAGPDLSGAPVVVLTGHGTGSAGECVAVAFKGRAKTWFAGEPTAGMTTGNNGHWIIPGKVGIVIAESVLVDRKYRIYRSALIPDEWIPNGDDFNDYDADKKIAAAITMLEKK